MSTSLLLSASVFGTKHLILLACSIIIIVLVSIFLRKIKLKTWFKILLYTGILSESIKIITYIVLNEELYAGYLPKSDLPLQLCSIQLIFIAILNFAKNEKVHRFLISFMLPTCLVGGFAAILLPTSSALNINIITAQYFIYHIVLICFSIFLYQTKEIKLTTKDLINTLKFLAFIGLLAIYFNSMFYDVVECTTIDGVKTVEYVNRVNFMYVVDPPASGLPLLNKDHGWLVYMVHYATIAIVTVCICYIKPIINSIKNRKNNGEIIEVNESESTIPHTHQEDKTTKQKE